MILILIVNYYNFAVNIYLLTRAFFVTYYSPHIENEFGDTQFSFLRSILFCTTHSFLRYDNQGKFLTNIKHWAKLHPPSIAISVKKHHKITKPFLSFCQFLLNCHHQNKMISMYDQFAVILDKVSKRKYFYPL